jgi:excisionase family DNA binding protein
MNTPLLNIRQAAARLCIAPKTLYKWVESGQIPYVRIGRLIRFRDADLDKWIAGGFRAPMCVRRRELALD